MCLFCDGKDVCDICATCEHCDGKTNSVDETYCDRCTSDFTCINCDNLSFEGEKVNGDYYCEDCYHNRFHMCAECCDVIDHDDCIIVDDDILCECCADEYYCCCCGEYHKDGEAYNCDYYCDSCFSDNFTTCDDCGETVPCDTITPCEDYSVCECCLTDNYFYCEGCGAYYHLDNYAGGGYCQDCDREEHGPGDPIIGTTTDRTGSSRCFGVEIETYRGEYDNRPEGWGCVEDGSIIGMELVSPIMSGDAGLESVEELYSDVEPSFCVRCGIHVHIDIRDLNKAERFAVIKAFSKSKDEWFSKVNPDRWDNSYCNGNMVDPDDYDNYDNYMRNLGYARYQWCNLQSISKHGTIELRLLEATDNVNKVVGWITDLLRFVDRAVAKHKELMTA